MQLLPFVLATLAASVTAHGNVASPPSRIVGNRMVALCGSVVSGILRSDINNNQQQLEQNSHQQGGGYTPACRLYLCKGTQYEDNTSRVQRYSSGQVVNFQVNLVAMHTGIANVSVVNLAQNRLIGAPLISWTDYASTAHAAPLNNSRFSVTIPSLGSQCSQPGSCALQWWWDSRQAGQTYMSCVDFTA